MTLDSHVPQTNSLILFTEAFGPAAVSLLPAISLLVEEALAPPPENSAVADTARILVETQQKR